MTEPRVTIHRYSERGLVNAWVEAIRTAGDPIDILIKCLRRIRLIHSGAPITLDKEPLAVDIYPECSLSQFGDPDLVLILHYADKSSDAIFIEAKLTPFLVSSPPESERRAMPPYTENASTVLHELYLKAVFFQAMQEKNDIEGGIAVYEQEPKNKAGISLKRKIGSDPQVMELKMRLSGCDRVFFVALTSDRLPLAAKDQMTITALIRHISSVNSSVNLFKSTLLPTNAAVLSWHDLWELAKREALGEFAEALQENIRKFTFCPLTLTQDQHRALLDLWKQIGLEAKVRDSGRITLRVQGGKTGAFATCSIVDAFDQPRLEFYLIKKSRSDKKPCVMSVPWDTVESLEQIRREINCHLKETP